MTDTNLCPYCKGTKKREIGGIKRECDRCEGSGFLSDGFLVEKNYPFEDKHSKKAFIEHIENIENIENVVKDFGDKVEQEIVNKSTSSSSDSMPRIPMQDLPEYQAVLKKKRGRPPKIGIKIANA